MVENRMIDKLKKVFDLKKGTLDQPSDSSEQECLFVEVSNARSEVKEKRLVSRISGKCTVFAQNGKLPLGYFSKKIQTAGDDAKDFFFFDMEENTNSFRNIVERSFSFIYFDIAQNDPDIGLINQILTEVQVSE